MAETNFQPKSDIEVMIGTKAAGVALGTAMAAGDTWHAALVTDYSFSVVNAPVETAPQRAGTYGHVESMGHHRPDTQTYEASLTFRGSKIGIEKVFLALMGDGASAISFLPTSNTGSMKHGVANASLVDLVFANAGNDATNIDLLMKSCLCTSATISQSAGTNGGETVLEATFWTAYRPEDIANFTPSSLTADSGLVKNIFGLTGTLASQPLFIDSWSITASRSLARVGYSETTNYLPFGYVQTSPYEITGSLTVKRDDSIEDLIDEFKGNSTGIALNLADATASDFTINCPDVMIDGSTVDSGGDFLMQEIPFRAFGASESGAMMTITLAN